MISEPELVDDPGPDPAATGARDTLDTQDTQDVPRRARSRRPWLWAVGGAVVASAVWAGGLFVYDWAGPGLGGYRTDRDPCRVARLDGLASVLGSEKGEGSRPPQKREHSALFRWNCSVRLAGGPGAYDVVIDYELHRKTDPGPELDARMTDLGYERTEGLGDVSYVDGGGERSITLVVRDGQAVLRMFVMTEGSLADRGSASEDDPEAPEVDPDALRTHTFADMRQLMSALKS
ncbi:hypothetical protein ABZ990_29595 [Streptomyces sp. NPDC046203]|uniref:hypothetical protein n=1 Tax=Streptomyces sp. NPDC046203 TaxID=3154602 RepID=UPI0033EC4F2A